MYKVTSRHELESLRGNTRPAAATPAPAAAQPSGDAETRANIAALSKSVLDMAALMTGQARAPVPVAMPGAASIVRDHQNRIESVSFGALQAHVERDASNRMTAMRFERAGRTFSAQFERDGKGRIQSFKVEEK